MSNLETPTIIRRKLFQDLPESIRALSEQRTLRRLAQELAASRLNDAINAMTKARQELEEIAVEVGELDIQLRDAIEKYVKENL